MGRSIDSWENAVQAIRESPVPLVVILDPLEIFASASRPTVIYTLLDALHKSRGLLFLGVSRRINALESLERRVRSRFSQGSIAFYGLSKHEDLIAVIKGILTLPPDFSDTAFATHWNSSVSTLLAHPRLEEILSEVTMEAGDVRMIQNLISQAIRNLNIKKEKTRDAKLMLDVEGLAMAAKSLLRDKRADMIKGLPEDTIGLLVAAKRLADNHRNATEPILLKVDTIVSHYYTFSTSENYAKIDPTEKEHFIDALRHLERIGLLHLHGHSRLVSANSNFSPRFDSEYLTAVINSMSIGTSLKTWSKSWVE
eukprot:Phypoly_transcript_05538.p1 GENE.Phypoly_transcript_05538~~Phypoly_transcript_05538.p1  ORF type:complete len:356 (-),score=38.85 Phypoly_transcript_05538:874-1806(-)